MTSLLSFKLRLKETVKEALDKMFVLLQSTFRYHYLNLVFNYHVINNHSLIIYLVTPYSSKLSGIHGMKLRFLLEQSTELFEHGLQTLQRSLAVNERNYELRAG